VGRRSSNREGPSGERKGDWRAAKGSPRVRASFLSKKTDRAIEVKRPKSGGERGVILGGGREEDVSGAISDVKLVYSPSSRRRRGKRKAPVKHEAFSEMGQEEGGALFLDQKEFITS